MQSIYSADYLFMDTNLKLFRANDVVSIEHVLCSQQESSFTFYLASWCASLSVEFDLLFAFSVLSC